MKITGALLPDGTRQDLFVERGVFVSDGSSTTSIDANGNSVRGLAACRRIGDAFGLHLFRTHPDPRHVAEHAIVELRRMARWLQLEEVVVVPRGNLCGELAAAMLSGGVGAEA